MLEEHILHKDGVGPLRCVVFLYELASMLKLLSAYVAG